MKRFISGFVCGLLIFGVIGVFAVSYVANPADFKVMVNGKEFVSDPPALEVEGRTYLPLRAIGEALGVPVTWNEELQQAEVGSNTKPQADKEYSRTNPAPLNTVQVLNHTDKYIESNNYSVSVRVIETVRGEEAWKMVKEANSYNDKPEEGKEYILAKIALSVLSTNDDEAYDLNSYDFDAFSSNNEEYPSVYVVKPEPNFEGRVYPGGSAEGWLCFQINKDDANPKIAFDLDYNGTNGLWFALQ